MNRTLGEPLDPADAAAINNSKHLEQANRPVSDDPAPMRIKMMFDSPEAKEWFDEQDAAMKTAPFTLEGYSNLTVPTYASNIVRQWLEESRAINALYPPGPPSTWLTRVWWTVRSGLADAFRWIAYKIDGRRIEEDF